MKSFVERKEYTEARFVLGDHLAQISTNRSWAEYRIVMELAEISVLLGDYSRGREEYSRALSSIQATDDLQSMSSCLLGLAELERAIGEFDSADRYFNEALRIALETGNKRIASKNLQ